MGLRDVKEIAMQIVAANVINKRRAVAFGHASGISKHMVFTGNPGSAKTTVARILANMLREEGAIESDRIVECGRADLVGKYVGWTAHTVRKKFREANGGILFIDEAYSLVDSSGSFGDEAINTIYREIMIVLGIIMYNEKRIIWLRAGS